MRAAVVTRYGPPEVVETRDVPVPVPRHAQVLVRVAATTVNSGDARIRGADFPPGFAAPARLAIGFSGPRHPVLGATFSGEVVDVGHGVTTLQVGTQVAGMTGFAMGAHAEYVVVDARRAVRKPLAVDHDDAAGVLFGGTTALHFLRTKAQVAPGQRVLVNGASGAVGTAAVQIARDLGARVTGVCGPDNVDLVASLGADEVVDHTRTPVTGLGARFDAVLDCVGNLTPASGRDLLAPRGTLLLAVASLWQIATARGDVVTGTAAQDPEQFLQLLDLVAQGRLTVVRDRAFDLEEIVEAHRLVDAGRKRGVCLVRP